MGGCIRVPASDIARIESPLSTKTITNRPVTRAALADTLAAGITALDLDIVPAAQQRLLDYLVLVEKWNKAYNLTAVREPAKMLTHHLLDSLAVLPHVRGSRVLDVGSGAGLPGIPLAVAQPQWQFVLLDSSHKKTTFLRQAVIELRLSNVGVVCDRVEHGAPAQSFDTVVSRAFSDLPEFIALAGNACARDGVMVAMKGVYPHEELAQVPADFKVCSVVPLNVPGLAAERHAAILQRAS